MMRHLLFVVLLVFAPGLRAESCTAASAAALARVALALDHGDIDEANTALIQVPDTAAACPQVLLWRARIAAARDDSSRAADLFGRYIEAAPDDPRGYAWFARLLLDEGNDGQADAMSAVALQKSPVDPAALAVRGQILAMKGDQQGGVDLLTQACRLNPEDAEAQFQLGAIYDRAKLPGDAVAHFRQAVKLNPRDARAWDYLGLNLEPLGQIAQAAAAYEQALRVDRDGPFSDSFVDYNYGRFLMKQGDFSASKVHLDRAVQLVPDMRATWYERARLEVKMNDYQAARRDAEKAASLADPDGIIIDLQIYTILEQIYRRLGETRLAEKYAELERTTPPPVRGEHRQTP